MNKTTTDAGDSSSTAYAAPAWAQAMRRFTDYMSYDFLGGPRPWKLAWVINFQKAGTFLFLLPVAIFTFLLRNHLLRGVTFGAIRK